MNDEFGKKKTKRSNDDVPNPDGGNGIDSAVTKNSDQIEKATRKRKDKNEDDVEEENEYDHENDGPTAPKKPRFLWSKDLHHKFLVAVNQFGVDSTFFLCFQCAKTTVLVSFINCYIRLYFFSYVLPSILNMQKQLYSYLLSIAIFVFFFIFIFLSKMFE